MKFSDFSLHHQILTAVEKAGYDNPTPIQSKAIPEVLSGKDLLGLAQTGTGKTAAFALPILNRFLGSNTKGIKALILAPTRELADQIHTSFEILGKQTRLRSTTIYGGVNIQTQIRNLKNGVDIVVACPGRLLDHIRQSTIYLKNLEVLVLDEADRMFDMGFLPDIRRILQAVPAKRQTLLFSATMPNDIRKLAQDILQNPVTVQINQSRPAATVTTELFPVATHLKTKLLIELLKKTDAGSVLIFTKTKHKAKRIGEQLQSAGFKATSLQGNLSQNRRKEALDGFRCGNYQIMVATDIAARGIDVSTISHVINYDMPDTVDAFIHRIGRTGRAERHGDAFSFITKEDEPMVKAIEKVLGERMERRQLQDFDYTQKATQAADAPGGEFARPPRQQNHRNSHQKSTHMSRPETKTKQKNFSRI